MKRRDFIKSSALLGLASTVPTFAIHQGLKKQYKVGIVGYGDRGSGLHTVFNQIPDLFKVTAVCDTLSFRTDRIKNIGKSAGIKVYTDHKQMAADKDLDIILISTPLSFHFEQAKTALEAGKHVYLEKAMTHTAAEAITLQNLASNYPKQVIQIGHQYRYSPLYFKVKNYIQSGYLGKVTQIEVRWDRNHNWRRHVPNPDLERQINWRMYHEFSGGLAAELLSHQMDFIHWAFETKPDSIFASGGIDFFKDGRETFDNVQILARYDEAGMIGNFGATCSNAHEGYVFKIRGNKGTVSLFFNDGYFYAEEGHIRELQEVDGVSGATKLNWTADKKGIRLIDEPLKDGSFYALTDFYRCLEEADMPHANVMNGGSTAIAVAMANESLLDGKLKLWKV
ncbi:Gfo/Idh/MocA family oxidoreductase [Belliella sp. DSM 111904]|uniref:Gfo/Idh/MocA family oxidoreductase n=1 Tax=Belliella filtrata TaxID=2923435 RepID=A0ABS9UYU9_9BACT|nr:Gfo/Idh/MocA family oxidoreductase [Belliella filtrata]MCH7409294.1 Gfo/Idh/MocA family oxidoreductase [Belliella filtrata]